MKIVSYRELEPKDDFMMLMELAAVARASMMMAIEFHIIAHP